MVQRLIEQALRKHRAGRLEEAKTLYEQALESQPRHPDALNLAGVLALQTGAADQAVSLIRRAIEVQPNNPAFHGNLAQAWLALKRIADAQASYRRAAALDPREPQFAVGAANCLAMQGSLAQAESELRTVAQRHRGYPLAWFNLGNVLRQQGRLEEAAEMYQRVIRLDPAFADAHNHLGCVLHECDQFDAADEAYRKYLSLRPAAADAFFNLASLLLDRGSAAGAAEICRKGIERCAGLPGLSQLQTMLGNALGYQGQFAAALVAFRLALDADPDNTSALMGYGVALIQTGNEQEGLQWIKRALEREPDSPEFHHAMAGVHLALGNLQPGWREYVWRPARREFIERFPQIQLAGQIPDGLPGKRMLVLGEQGLGDELFFLRFAPELKSREATIAYRASAKIAPLLGRVAALDQVITNDATLPARDLTVLAGDLPQLLHKWGFPRPLALSPLPERLEAIRNRLAGLGRPPYRGLTWRAGTAPEQQRGRAWVLHKEIPLESLGTALRGTDGTLIALQRNPLPGEIERLSGHAAAPVHDLTALNEDLESMLAVLALIEDYIGVSNTNMHLRAGTVQAARVLLPRPAEWRWMAAGEESPWFPGFRIYRQGIDGDWGTTLARLHGDLLTAFSKGNA